MQPVDLGVPVRVSDPTDVLIQPNPPHRFAKRCRRIGNISPRSGLTRNGP
jgi:hypothetical protein